MNKVTFKCSGGPFKCSGGTVLETNGRVVASYSEDHVGLAVKHAEFLNEEHKNGRVAQGICQKGHACDRDRITHPDLLLRPSDIVLCEEHDVEMYL